jgi:hypothetical protein
MGLALLVPRLPDPPPEPVRLVGILLVTQGVLRLVFLPINVHQVGLALGLNIFTAYTILAAVFGAAATAAGALALQRFALARGFALAFCAAGVLYELWSVVDIVRLGWASRLPLDTWIVILGFTGIDAVGLLVFRTSPYYRADARTQP